MALVKEKPVDIQPENDLDDIVDPNEPDAPAYLSFGTTPAALDNPPDIDEVRTYIIRTRCTGRSEKERNDGETRHSRQLTIQACWEAGNKPPAADDQQPALFDHDNLSGDEPQQVGEVIDSITSNDGYDPSGMGEFAAVRPPFSDGTK